MPQQEVLEYKCPHCGGKIEYGAASGQMECPYCGSRIDVAALQVYDATLLGAGGAGQGTGPGHGAGPEQGVGAQAGPGDGGVSGQGTGAGHATDGAGGHGVAPDTGDGPGADTGGYTVSGGAGATWQAGEQENMLVYSCNSCGGQIVTDLTTAATHCPYCGNPVIMTGQLSGALRPDWVIPFSRTKEDALAALNKHYRGKPLLPRVFKDENHIEEVKGLYVPFWLFGYDAAGDVHWHATRVTYGSDSKYNYTYTSHYAIWRAGQATLDNVPVDGSSKMPDALMESIEPFDYSQAVDFGTAYLSGFFADKYDVDDAKSAPRAATRARNTLESMLGETAGGYTTMAKESAAIDLDQTGCRYALLPVWVLSTKWRDKYYLFAMNGQTGKLVGNLPVSPLAFFLYFAGIMGGITAVVFALVWFLA